MHVGDLVGTDLYQVGRGHTGARLLQEARTHLLGVGHRDVAQLDARELGVKSGANLVGHTRHAGLVPDHFAFLLGRGQQIGGRGLSLGAAQYGHQAGGGQVAAHPMRHECLLHGWSVRDGSRAVWAGYEARDIAKSADTAHGTSRQATSVKTRYPQGFQSPRSASTRAATTAGCGDLRRVNTHSSRCAQGSSRARRTKRRLPA